MSTPVLHGDPGLQPERTTLAWTRTTVSYAVASAILLGWLPQYGPLVLVLIGLMTGAALAIYLSQRPRYRASAAGLSAGRARAQVGAVVAMTLGMMAFGISGIVLILNL